MADGSATLLHGYGGEGWRADHVADCVDTRDRGLIVFVYGDRAVPSEFQIEGIQSKRLRICDTALGDQHLVAGYLHAILELRLYLRDMVPLDALVGRISNVLAAMGGEVVEELFRALRFHEHQRPGSAIEHGYLDAQ